MTTPLPVGQVLDDLVQLGCFAADRDVIAAPEVTDAERTRIAIRSALHALIVQGYLVIAEPDTWPKWFSPDNDRTGAP